MGINELFDGIARVIEQFTEELAEQRMLEKKQKTGRHAACSKLERFVLIQWWRARRLPEIQSPQRRHIKSPLFTTL